MMVMIITTMTLTVMMIKMTIVIMMMKIMKTILMIITIMMISRITMIMFVTHGSSSMLIDRRKTPEWKRCVARSKIVLSSAHQSTIRSTLSRDWGEGVFNSLPIWRHPTVTRIQYKFDIAKTLIMTEYSKHIYINLTSDQFDIGSLITT